MIHGLTFKEYVEEEKQKLSEMSGAEKKQYFIDYYLKFVIGVCVVILILIWMIVDLALNMRNVVVTGGVVNVVMSDEGYDYLQDDYLEFLQLSTKGNKAYLGNIFLNGDDPQSYTVFNAEIATNTYNYVITDNDGLEFMAKVECLADMNEVLDKDLYDKLKDNLVYKKSGESGSEIAAAIDITDTAFTKDYIQTGEKVYFVISGNAEDYESGLNILRYILEKK